jgi:uncharacterized protein (DUF1800 family)
MNITKPNSPWRPFRSSQSRPWSNKLAAHLLRRAGFGGTITEIEAAQKAGLEATLDQLFNAESAAAYNEEMATAGRLVSGGSDSKSLAAWWLLRMVQTPCPLVEKMTLFWHGHFATGADKVNDARAMLRQNMLLREHALGNFEPLIQEISRDVATLIYLDSEDNRKTRPNENYARELMELFCLGPGNYTEQDIKEISRCFTGWEVRNGKFRFNSHQHDDREKSVLGQKGNFDGTDAVKIVVQQDAAARFIARKLIRFFVADQETISRELVEPLATELRRSEFDIRRTVRTILASEYFYSPAAIGKKIKSPVELAIGFLRFFGASVNMPALAEQLSRLGQLPLYPPNVKGWDGGKSWINASTVLARANLIAKIANSGDTTFQDGSLAEWAKSNPQVNTTSGLKWANEYLLALPLPAAVSDGFDKMNVSDMRTTISWLAALPEYQLN